MYDVDPLDNGSTELRNGRNGRNADIKLKKVEINIEKLQKFDTLTH